MQLSSLKNVQKDQEAAKGSKCSPTKIQSAQSLSISLLTTKVTLADFKSQKEIKSKEMTR